MKHKSSQQLAKDCHWNDDIHLHNENILKKIIDNIT